MRDVRRKVGQRVADGGQVAPDLVANVRIGVLAIDERDEDLLDGLARALRARLQGHDVVLDRLVSV